jgi:lysophospholipase L1-like esterase
MSGSLGVTPDARLVAVRQVRTDSGAAVYFALQSLATGEAIAGATGLSARYWLPGKAYAEANANPVTPVQVSTGQWLVPLPLGAGSLTVQMRITAPVGQTAESVFDPADLAPPAQRRSAAELGESREHGAIAGSDAAAALVKEQLDRLSQTVVDSLLPVTTVAVLSTTPVTREGQRAEVYADPPAPGLTNPDGSNRNGIYRGSLAAQTWSYNSPSTGALDARTQQQQAAIEQIPAVAANVPGWALALLDSGRRIGGGLRGNWREWSLAGFKHTLLGDGTLRLTRVLGGGTFDFLPDGGVSMRAGGKSAHLDTAGNFRTPNGGFSGLISAVYRAALTHGNQALLKFRHDGGTEIGGWGLGRDATLTSKAGVAVRDAGDHHEFGGVGMTRRPVRGMALVCGIDQYRWRGGVRNDGSWFGAGSGGDVDAQIRAITDPLDTRVTALEAAPISAPVRPVLVGGRNVTTRLDASQPERSPGAYLSVTGRIKVTVPAEANSLVAYTSSRQLVYLIGETRSPAAFTDKIAVEYNGRIYPFVWNGGATSQRVRPGEEFASDPLPLRIPAGTEIIIRTTRTVSTLGDICALGRVGLTARGEGAVLSDQFATAIDSYPAQTQAACPAPVAVVGYTAAPAVSCLISGSSSHQGTGDSAEAPTWDLGYSSRLCATAGIAYSRQSLMGSTMSGFQTGNQVRRDFLIRSAPNLVLMGYGSNDVPSAGSLAEMQDRTVRMLEFYGGLGVPVILYTLTPRVTGTYTTLVGQTPEASDPLRLQTNAWIRGLSHWNLHGVLDAAAAAQDAGDPSRWRVDLGSVTNDGLHPNQLGHRTEQQALQTPFNALAASRLAQLT